MQPDKDTRRKAGRPGNADAASLSTAILNAAENIFLAKGFGGASVESIATAAGTSKQTIYARFGSKEQLFIAVSEALLSTKFTGAIPQHASLRDKLLAVARQMLDAMLDPKMVRMYAIVTAEAWRSPTLARAADDDDTFKGRSLIREVLVAAISAGEASCQDERAATLMFQDMVLTTPLRSAALGLNTFSNENLDEWAAKAVEMFLGGVSSKRSTQHLRVGERAVSSDATEQSLLVASASDAASEKPGSKLDHEAGRYM